MLADAAALEVEEGLLVELADGGAVGAHDVVGEDLELGLSVDLGAGREQEVLVHLVGLGLLGARADENASGENAPGLAGEQSLVHLVRLGAGSGMIDERVVVDVAVAVGVVEAEEAHLGAGSGQRDVDVAPRELSSEVDGDRRDAAVASLVDVDGGDVVSAGALTLEGGEAEVGAGGGDDLGNGVGEVLTAVEALVADEDGRAAVRSGDDEGPWVGRGLLRPGGDEQEIDGFAGGDAVGNVNEGPVVEEGGVERGEAVVVGGGDSG